MSAISALDNPAIVSIQTAVRRYNRNALFTFLGIVVFIGLGYLLYKFLSRPKQVENLSKEIGQSVATCVHSLLDPDSDGKKDSPDGKA